MAFETIDLLMSWIIAGVALSGAVGAILAAVFKRNGMVWLLVSLVFPLVGPVAMALLAFFNRSAADVLSRGDARSEPKAERGGSDTAVLPAAAGGDHHAASRPMNGQIGLAAVSLDERWSMLIEYDPVLREANEQLAPLGPEAVGKLRQAYFVLQDRALIPGIVDRIREKHAAQLRAAASALGPSPVRLVERPPLAVLQAQVPAPIELLNPDTIIPRQPAVSRGPSARSVPKHTTVTPQDLDSATYIETFCGVHLYRLGDGRTYIDGHMALASQDAARNLVQQSAPRTGRDATGTTSPLTEIDPASAARI